MTASAPRVFASSSRVASRVVPLTTISEAPACLEATTCESPCWPGPWMSTVDALPTSPALSAHSMPLDSGVTRPASSAETPSGTLWVTAFHGRYMYWEKPPQRRPGLFEDV